MESENTALPSYGAPKVPPIATPESVAARLGANDTPERITSDTGTALQQETPVVEEPAPVFDLSKLQPEQLIALKAMLENAPLRVVKKGNPVVKLRRMDGRIIVDFGNCINTLRKDELTQVTSEVVLIPVKFLGADGKPDEKFTNVIYRDFMNADQIKCEVINKRSEEGGYDEGEVESNERPGIMVELHVTTVQDFFTVKLPEGSPVATLEIEAKIANA